MTNTAPNTGNSSAEDSVMYGKTDSILDHSLIQITELPNVGYARPPVKAVKESVGLSLPTSC